MAKLKFSNTETDFLTFGEFYDLYREYQKTFDIETMLRAGRMTYRDMEKRAKEKEEIVNF